MVLSMRGREEYERKKRDGTRKNEERMGLSILFQVLDPEQIVFFAEFIASDHAVDPQRKRHKDSPAEENGQHQVNDPKADTPGIHESGPDNEKSQNDSENLTFLTGDEIPMCISREISMRFFYPCSAYRTYLSSGKDLSTATWTKWHNLILHI